MPAIRREGVRFHFDNVYNTAPLDAGAFYLYQIGDLSSESGYVGPWHRQLCYEITYIVSGTGEFLCDGVRYPVKRGDVFINHPGEEHQTVSSTYDPLRFFYVGFMFNEQDANLERYSPVIDLFYNRKTPVTEDRYNIISVFITACNEFVADSPLHSEMIESCLQQLVCYVYRDFFKGQERLYAQKSKHSSTEDIVYEIINYIDVNIQTLKNLSDISDHLGYSYPYISGVFSKEMGVTLKNYLSSKKVEHAEKLLCGGMSITETSDTLGYDSVHTFSRAFKRQNGMSPAAYRTEHSTDPPPEIGTIIVGRES